MTRGMCFIAGDMLLQDICIVCQVYAMPRYTIHLQQGRQGTKCIICQVHAAVRLHCMSDICHAQIHITDSAEDSSEKARYQVYQEELLVAGKSRVLSLS